MSIFIATNQTLDARQHASRVSVIASVHGIEVNYSTGTEKDFRLIKKAKHVWTFHEKYSSFLVKQLDFALSEEKKITDIVKAEIHEWEFDIETEPLFTIALGLFILSVSNGGKH